MTILAYSEPDTHHGAPMPIGCGRNMCEAVADAMLTLAPLGLSNETLVFRDVDLTADEEAQLRAAIDAARKA